MSLPTIPVIDLRDAVEPRAPRSLAVAAELRAACENTGFFYITGHGVPTSVIDGMFDTARALFDLPQNQKDAISLHKSPVMRGYEAIGDQTLDAASLPDLKESFYAGIEYPPSHPYVIAGYQSYGANQWPAALPGIAERCTDYIDRLCGLSRRLMQWVALALDLPASTFDHAHASPMVTLRLLRYPPHPAGADARLWGAGAHTDWGALTLLAQDGCGGLEVQMPPSADGRPGAWVAAPPVADSFVVNLGDMMPRWTNGRFHSNPHRVRNLASGGLARYSIPFFYSPDYLTRVEPLPGCSDADHPPRWPPCTVGEHLHEMYMKTYGLDRATRDAASRVG
jgi:isopenicillin N synthase-like dioxygenase